MPTAVVAAEVAGSQLLTTATLAAPQTRWQKHHVESPPGQGPGELHGSAVTADKFTGTINIEYPYQYMYEIHL